MSHKSGRLSLSKQVLSIDKDTTFLAHYDISINDVLYGIEPSGGYVVTLRKNEGKYGGGVAIEESTSNLIVTHPTATVGVSAFFDRPTGWNLINNSDYISAIEPNPESIYGKGNVLRVTDNDGNITGNEWGGVSLANRVTGLASGNTHSFKIRYKVENWTTGEVSIWSHQQDTTGTLGSLPSDFALPSTTFNKGWFEYESTRIVSGGYDARSFTVGMNKANLGCTMYVDAMQFEKKNFSTSFVDGARTDGKLIYASDNIINQGEGTISFWYKPSQDTTGMASQIISPKLLQVGNYYSNSSFTLWNINDGFSVYVKGPTDTGWSLAAYTGKKFTAKAWTMVSVTWKNKDWKVYKDGKIIYTGTATEPLGPIAGGRFFVGGDGNGLGGNGQVCNGIIDEFRIDKIARTDEEIESWYICDNPFYPKGIYRLAY